MTPEFKTHTGYAKEEVLGRSCRFLQGPATDPAAVGAIRNAVANKQPLEIEILNYRKDGVPFWSNLSIRPVFSEQGSLKSGVAVQSVNLLDDDHYRELEVA